MIYLRWALLALLDLVLLVANLFVAPVLSLFTKAEPDLDEAGEQWGGWFGTWDNPPQGDAKWQREGWFPGETTGWKGYLNRVGWLYRNPLYGYQRWAGIPYSPDYTIVTVGNQSISDKYKIPGSYLVRLYDGERLIGFEYYLVKPTFPGKCFRLRIGWKISTDKFERYGFAALVDTIHLNKTYG